MSPAWSLPSLGSGCPRGPVADVTDDTVFEVTVHEALCVAGINPGCSHRLEGGVSLRRASGVGDGRSESFLGSDTLVHVPGSPGVLLTRGHHQWLGSTQESLDSLGRQAAQGREAHVGTIWARARSPHRNRPRAVSHLFAEHVIFTKIPLVIKATRE